MRYHFEVMTERREMQKVQPRYSIEFIDPARVPEPVLNTQDQNFVHTAAIPYIYPSSEGSRLLVIRSDDERLVREMSEAARRFGEDSVTEERISKDLSIYSTRLPVASIEYGPNGSHINCEEPSCRFHVGGGCTNENVTIQDDCGDAQWCMTYEPDSQNN